jgi:hypothetical protein
MHRLPFVVDSKSTTSKCGDRLRAYRAGVWPDSVERIAAFLRASGAEGRLEQVLPRSEHPPGLPLGVRAFQCDGRLVVALVPSAHRLDRRKLAAVADCAALRPAPSAPSFPFNGAFVVLDQSALGTRTAWLELEPPGHFLGLAPAQLVRLTRSKTADLLRENQIGGG